MVRDFVKGRITDVIVLVGRGGAHGFADDADVVGGVVTDGSKVEVFEDVEHLHQHDAAAGRLAG